MQRRICTRHRLFLILPTLFLRFYLTFRSRALPPSISLLQTLQGVVPLVSYNRSNHALGCEFLDDLLSLVSVREYVASLYMNGHIILARFPVFHPLTSNILKAGSFCNFALWSSPTNSIRLSPKGQDSSTSPIFQIMRLKMASQG